MFTFIGSIDHNFVYIGHLILVAVLLIGFAVLATRNLKIVPTGLQNITEVYVSSLMGLAKDILGKKHAKKYFPLLATLGLFIFSANLLGIIPGFESPTAFLSFTLTLALAVFVYYNFEGLKAQGFLAYFKHMCGPVWWLSWLMLPVEIISHFSRIISLSFRLFGNIKGDDVLLMVLLMLWPWYGPGLPAYAVLVFMAVLQAFIFVMLTMIYLQSAIAQEVY